MTTDENWKPCPPGTIDTVARDQKRADDQQQMTRRAVFSFVAVAGAGIAYGLWPKQPGTSIGPLVCADVKSMAKDYVMGQLTPNQSAAVDAHLSYCKACAGYIEQLQESGTA